MMCQSLSYLHFTSFNFHHTMCDSELFKYLFTSTINKLLPNIVTQLFYNGK